MSEKLAVGIYDKFDPWQTTTKHNKAITVCITLGMYSICETDSLHYSLHSPILAALLTYC